MASKSPGSERKLDYKNTGSGSGTFKKFVKTSQNPIVVAIPASALSPNVLRLVLVFLGTATEIRMNATELARINPK